MSNFAEFLRKAAQEEASTAAPGSLSVFAEEPVSLTIFVQDKGYLGNPPLSYVQYEAVRHIERVYYQDTYDLLAREFEAGKKPGSLHVGSHTAWRNEAYWSQHTRMINFATYQWGKGSLSRFAPIYNSRTGQWVKLEDWNQPDLVASAHIKNGNIFPTGGSAGFCEGHGSMFRVRTQKGLESEVWEGHRFLSWVRGKPVGGKLTKDVDWHRLWDLKVGDPIAVSTLVPEPTEPSFELDRDVELMAMLVANGSLTGSNRGAFTCNADAPLTQQRICELFEDFPGTRAKSFLDTSGGSRRWRVVPKQGDTIYHSIPVWDALEQWGLTGCGAADKCIPARFFSVPNRQIALLVSRLIDTDGWVSFSNTPEIGYSTISKQLAQDVQRLFLRLGVLAELKEKKTTCQNCKKNIPDHTTPHMSYQVRVRDFAGLEMLANQLTLLDKDPQRLRILEWVEEKRGCRTKPRHGDLVWDEIESIEYLGEDEYWTLTVEGPASFLADSGILHHNSGKDHVCRITSMRIAYLLMCLESPQDYYQMPEQDTIHLLNVASSSGQAQQAFFMPITRAVRKGWFKDKCTPKQNVISYDKNIECISGHSDAEGQEGLNLMLGIADEIDAFKTKKEGSVRRGQSSREPTKSAEAILNMLRTSASTRFPEVFKNVRISYPRYLGSTIQRLTAEAREDIEIMGEDSRHYVSGPLPTWEVNPRVKDRTAFAADYKEDPVLARSKYECKPARAINPYFRNHQAVDACFEPADRFPLEVDYRLENNEGRSAWVPRYIFAKDFFPVRGANYAMHADLAVTGDRAGIAMAHVQRYSEHETSAMDEDGAFHPLREIRPHVKVDFVISYSSDSSADPPREIQIRWARQLCLELIRQGFNIKRLSFDSFQCLSGDTEIPLLDGTTRKIRELVDAAPFWVYSIKDGNVVPGLCTRAWWTGHRSDMVEVELDNGELVRATGDHRFMLRDGTYRRADQLAPCDCLMSRDGQSLRAVAQVRLSSPEDVYDLQVERYHNFAIGAGVFVHNSKDSMQILESKGIEAIKMSTDTHEDPWRNLRDLMYEGRITIPSLTVVDETNPPPFLLREELLSLTRLPNGKIDHPSDSCFVGETRIPLLDGTVPQIQDLDGKSVWVYSSRPDGSIVPGRAFGRKAKLVSQFVDVVLDTGYTVRCTPEHRWMLRDGTYKAASELVPGIDRLMPITRNWPVNGGYERVSDAHGLRKLTHVMVAEHFAERQVVANKEIVHHRNGNKVDNRPENLEIIDNSEHKAHHSRQRWESDAEYVQKMRDGHAAWRKSPAMAEALARRDLSRRWAGIDTPEERQAEMARILPFYRHDITLELLRSVVHEGNANSAARALGCSRNVVIARLKAAGYTSWAHFQVSCDANHKVRYVIPIELDEPVQVYDLEVDHWNNFALAGGVFVHNSKDLADALACAALGAIECGGAEEDAGERAYYTEPDIEVGSGYSLPMGTRLSGLWETEMPSPF